METKLLEALHEAVEVADRLHDKYYESMMETGEAQDFNVLFVPGTLYVAIRLGDAVIWDSEDENDGEDQVASNMQRHCEEELTALGRMFKVFLPE